MQLNICIIEQQYWSEQWMRRLPTPAISGGGGYQWRQLEVIVRLKPDEFLSLAFMSS